MFHIKVFPACWILIGQFKFHACQPYAKHSHSLRRHFVSLPSLFAFWIQDGAHLSKMHSFAKIHLHGRLVHLKCSVQYIGHLTYVCPFSCEPIRTGSLQVTWFYCERLFVRVTLCICNSYSLLWCTFHLTGLLSRTARHTALGEEHNECLPHLKLLLLQTPAAPYTGMLFITILIWTKYSGILLVY